MKLVLTALILGVSLITCVNACLPLNFGKVTFVLPHKNGTRQEIEVNKGIMNLFPAAYHILSYLFSDDPPEIPAKPVSSDLCAESYGQSIFCVPGKTKPTPNRPYSAWKPAPTQLKPPLRGTSSSTLSGKKPGQPNRPGYASG